MSDLKYINRDLLEEGGHTFGIHQVAWWDEKHVEQVVGELRDHTCQFGLDEDGIYSPDIIFAITERVSVEFKCYSLHLSYLYVHYIFYSLRSNSSLQKKGVSPLVYVLYWMLMVYRKVLDY